MSIGFGENGKAVYSKVWSVEDKGKYVKGQISTSRKDKDGNYLNSSWFVRFVGGCADKARDIDRGTTILITAGSIETQKAEDGKIYTNVVIFGFDFPEDNNSGQTQRKPVNGTGSKKSKAPTYEVEDSEDDEDLPF